MTLAEVRTEIDRVDAGIKELFKERMMLAGKIAEVKAETGDSVYKPEREAEVIQQLTADVDDDIKQEYTALLRRIMELSREYQYRKILSHYTQKDS